VSPSERKILLASGAAAGMAATFGAPLASVVLAIELLLFEFSTRAFIPLVVASGVAAGMHSLFFGTGPLFAVPHHDFAGLSKLPFYVVLGLLCGLLAVVITKGLFLIEDGFRRLPVSQFWWPAIGAVGFASIGVALPRVLGVGYDQISLVLAGRLGLALLAALAVAKLVAWWVALASGTSGGTLAPILLISGAFGAFLGQGAGRAFPWAHLSPGAFALVAMAATFGAATRATFASIIFLFELTRDYNAILPLMLASVVADLVAAWAMDDGIMTEKLTRRGLRVASDYHADVLGTTRVRAVMTAPVETVHDRDTVATVASRFKFDGHGAYPIVDDDGRCVGIVARGDLLRLGWGDEEILGEVALGEVVSVSPDDLVIDALRLILEEQIDHVPVIAGDRLLGICTRTDILRARREQFAHEKPQPGWRPVRRRRSG
ncbi:MAG TPA: chloride channel protein, partial [Acidimicrobiales bacterium]|nr:chloride channel protein [Acidimicrobiales bacterium]